jgi:hypothetical protein
MNKPHYQSRAKPTSYRSKKARCVVCRRIFFYLPSQAKGRTCTRRCHCIWRKTVDAERRFWARVQIGSKNECWNWIGYSGRNQRGNVQGNAAAKAAWQFVNGEVPKGLLVCHKCDNTLCCNQKHLFLGTHQDNSDDMVKKGRSLRGKRHPGWKHGRKCKV